MSEIIQVKDIVKTYDNCEVVSRLSFGVEKGDTFGLLGPNGAGKSTTISMIVGLIRPSSGEIYVKDMNAVKSRKAVNKIIGLVPQNIALYSSLSAESNLKFWGRMYGIKGKQLEQRINDVLKIVGLEEKKHKKIEKYSGGMQRRINIAAALLHNPEILIMDEPTVGIDPQSRNHILEMIRRLNSQGVTIIYTTHYMEEVEYLCNKVAIIDEGKIVAFDEKERLKNNVIDSERIYLKVSKCTDSLLEEIRKINSVERAECHENELFIYNKNDAQSFAKIIQLLSQNDAALLEYKIEKPNLETVFLKLTGKKLRD